MEGKHLIQYTGKDICKNFWKFSKNDKECLAKQLAIELPALRGKVNASQEEIVSVLASQDKLIAYTKHILNLSPRVYI